MKVPSQKHSLPIRLLTGLLAFVVCLLMPIIVTAVLGMSRLSLNRTEGQVTARLEHLVCFIIPRKTETLHDVRSVAGEVIAGSRIKGRRGQRDHNRYLMGHGLMKLNSPAQEMAVAIDPSHLPGAQAVVEKFLSEEHQTTSRYFLMANRLFGWVFGVPLTLLAFVYTLGAVLWLPARLLRRSGIKSCYSA